MVIFSTFTTGLIYDLSFLAYARELACNGPYQFFAAFRNNELDYPQLYGSLDEGESPRLIRSELQEPNARFVDPNGIRR